jgi:hypothetical protein
MSVCPLHGTTRLFDIWVFFRKFVQEIQVSIKSGKYNGYFTWRPIRIYDNISLISSLNEKCLTSVVEKIKTHILFLYTFSEYRTVYEIMWKKKNYWARQATDYSIIHRIPSTCFITKATDAHSEYVKLISIQWQQQFTLTRLNVTLYAQHCLV